MLGDLENKKAGDHSPASFVGDTRTDAPLYETVLRPHRSLPAKGFVWTIGIAAGLMTVPLFPLLGSFALWGLLPHLLFALWLLWYLLRRNTRDGELQEDIKIWNDLMTVYRFNPRKKDQTWQANPYWVEVGIKDHPHIKNYLTLRGGDREIEIGAFLTPEERLELRNQIDDVLRRVRNGSPN